MYFLLQFHGLMIYLLFLPDFNQCDITTWIKDKNAKCQ